MTPKYSTKLLDKTLERRREAVERQRLELMKCIFTTLDKFSNMVEFEEAYIFGSVTKPYKFNPSSDVDIGFVSLKNDDVIKAIAYLSREIGRDVDVIQLEDHRLSGKIKGGIKWKRGK